MTRLRARSLRSPSEGYDQGLIPSRLPDSFAKACLDPPLLHPGAPQGVWRTEQSCYEFIAQHVDDTSVTLETGLGLSTVAFAMVGCHHTAVFHDPREGDQLRAWARQHDVNLDRVELFPGRSDLILPSLPADPLDLVFIDGGHAYPLPQLDWFYAASRLRRGGVLVIDDRQLWAPRQLIDFLSADPRWTQLAGTAKWAGFQRLFEWTFLEAWSDQDFLPHEPKASWRRHIRRTLRRLRILNPRQRYAKSNATPGACSGGR
jgi:hypothetical protein